MPRPNKDKTEARDKAAKDSDAKLDRAGGKEDATGDRLDDTAIDKLGELRDDVESD